MNSKSCYQERTVCKQSQRKQTRTKKYRRIHIQLKVMSRCKDNKSGKLRQKTIKKLTKSSIFVQITICKKAKEIINEVKEVNESLEADLILWKGNIAKTEGKAN